MKNTKLKLIFGDVSLGVEGPDFHCIFSYQAGGMESLRIRGKEWLYHVPRPAFWRAMTDNDRGGGFHRKSGMWLLADSFLVCKGLSLKVDEKPVTDFKAPYNNQYCGKEEADTVTVTYVYNTLTTPETEAEIRYTVYSDGRIRVEGIYHGKEGLPQLPVFGVRFVIPTPAVKYLYQGLSGETYPDRLLGGQKGIWEVQGLPVTPYLTPQDCGMHMETEWVEIVRSRTLKYQDKDESEFSIRFLEDGKPFAFTCLPYTPEQMEFCDLKEELPPVRRTVLTIYGGVRGIGGIDAWGSDVEPDYRLYGNDDIHFSFIIKHDSKRN